MDISYCLVDSSELIKVTIAGHFDRDATTKACAELATGISQRDTREFSSISGSSSVI